MKQIRKFLYKTSVYKLLQRHLGKSVNIHGISADKKRKRLNMLCSALLIGTIQRLHIIHLLNAGRLPADRTHRRNCQSITLRQILRNLRNDHIRLVNRDLIPDSQLQTAHNADIVYRSPAHSSPLQFYRLEDCHRIDQPGTTRAPLHLQKCCLPNFIRPFERNGVSGKLGRASQRSPVCDILVQEHQPVGRDIILLDLLFKIRDLIQDRIRLHQIMLHHLKSLFL